MGVIWRGCPVQFCCGTSVDRCVALTRLLAHDLQGAMRSLRNYTRLQTFSVRNNFLSATVQDNW